ncbi:MAG: hypothetical protein IJ313_08955 [Clostridia bacterium]|nr:hypothetical protein [Clostridia bacterium]
MKKTKDILRRIAAAAALMIAVCSAAGAETVLTPQLTDPQDQAAQRLGVMSQRDGAFEGLRYNGGYLTARGCQPVSVTNALIAALGVEDRQAAIALVKEAAEVLVIERARGTGRMELSRMQTLLSRQDRMAQAQDYPQLAAAVGGYAGEITVLEGQLDATAACEYFMQRPSGMLVGRMTVHPDWTALLEIVQRLHEMGMDGATLCLASVSAGTEPSGTPFGSGKGGHYLTLMMHVDTFAQQGRMYVLDSLPRALAGEESGYTCALRSPYPFSKEKMGFAKAFDAGRISETVIRLTPADEAAWQSASVEQRAKMLAPLILYGPGVLMIAAN